MTIDKYLNQLMTFGVKLGLEQERELLARLGNPHHKMKFLHLAGTNGKGSCGAMLESGLRVAGRRTGFYSSPHLAKINERFKVNGSDIADKKLNSLADRVWCEVENMRKKGLNPTYFEFTTALAALYFAESNCDFVVWETGMGGRFDATNVVDCELAVITTIALEHTQYLGDTLPKIAFEKAGIIKKNQKVFCGVMADAAYEKIAVQAQKSNSDIFRLPDKKPKSILIRRGQKLLQKFSYCGCELEIPLLGAFQVDNARLAFEVLKFLASKYDFDFKTALTGLKNTFWPGRMQVLDDGSIVDGAHNPAGIKALLDFLTSAFAGEELSVIFGAFDDKDVDESLQMLSSVAAEFIFCPIAGERKSYTPEKLERILADKRIRVHKCTSIADALKIPARGRRVICGSLYLAGSVCCK